MADPITATTAAGTNSGATPANVAGASSPPVDPSKVFNSQWKALRQQKRALEAQAAASGVVLPKFNNKKGNNTAPVPESDERYAQVRKELADMRDRNITEKREAALETAMAAHKLDPESAELLKALVATKYKHGIKGGDGADVYFQVDDTSPRKPIKELIGDILSSPLGDRFKPGTKVQSTQTDGMNTTTTEGGGRKFFSDLTQEQRDKMTYEERAAHVREDLRLSRGR